jgi:formylglycine-generating enzyme required for sulfatase activity
MTHRLVNVPTRLVRSLRSGDCIPFIGAGISRQAGLPLWGHTVEKAVSRILGSLPARSRAQEKSFLANASALEVFERCKIVLPPNEYYSFLLDQFACGHEPTDLHRAIARLPAPFFVTTNFDPLLELAIQETSGRAPLVCTRYDHIVLAQSRPKPFVVKLHGTIQDVHSIVIAESDYDSLEINHPTFLDFMRSTLDMKVVLFLGYSLSDPDLRALQARSRVFTAGMRRDDFAVLKGVTVAETSLLRGRGVEVIRIASFNDVLPFVDQLGKAVASDRHQERIAHTADAFVRTVAKALPYLRRRTAAYLHNATIFGGISTTKLDTVFTPRVLARGDRTGHDRDALTACFPTDANLLLQDPGALVVVGGPGSGKSLLLRFIAAWWATRPRKGVSVYIPLGRASIAGDLIDIAYQAITDALGRPSSLTHDDLELVFLHTPCLICVDGVDEVSISARPRLIRTLWDALARFPKLRLVISSRSTDGLDLGKVTVWHLRPFTDSDAYDAALRWFRCAGRTDSDIADALGRLMPMAADLHQTPLSLAALCSTAGSFASQSPTRTDVTRAVVHALVARGAARADFARMQSRIPPLLDALAAVAYELRSHSDDESWNEDVLVSAIAPICETTLVGLAPTDMIHFLVEGVGILSRAADGRLSFMIRPVYELLVAEHLATRPFCDSMLAARSRDSNWSNILRYTVGASKVDSQDARLQLVARHNSPLGLACLLEVKDWPKSASNLLSIENEDEVVTAVRALPSRVAPLQLVQFLEPLFDRSRRNGLVLYFVVQSLERLLLDDSSSVARAEARRVLDSFWGEAKTFGGRPDLTWIPGGKYFIGDDYGLEMDERPRHLVRLSRFAIGTKPVLNQEYMRFAPNYIPDSKSGGASMPVTNVTWYEASLYCRWVLGPTGRLPSEAQWEAAARGGLEHCQYPWGDDPSPQRGNFGRSVDRPTEPGRYPPNRFGLYDMAGNVFEWCNDWWDGSYYASCPSLNPDGPARGRYKAMRGGCWARGPEVARCAYRVRQVPDTRDVLVGFRVSLQPSK